MTMRPAPLPPELGNAFTVPDARAHGISKKRLRASDLDRPFHGTRAVVSLSLLEKLSLLMRALPPHAFVCGLTAAAFFSFPLGLVDGRRAWELLHIGVPSEHTRIRRAGVFGCRLSLDPDDIVVISGIRLLSVERTWVQISSALDLPRLVAVTDFLIGRRRLLSTSTALTDIAERCARLPGAAARRFALRLADERSESPRESMLRVMLIAAGLPRPMCNVEIFDGTRFVARVDMLYPEARLIIEYDGDYHRDPRQWSRDQQRRAELESLGHRVTVVTARDFDDPQQLIARIRRLLEA